MNCILYTLCQNGMFISVISDINLDTYPKTYNQICIFMVYFVNLDVQIQEGDIYNNENSKCVSVCPCLCHGHGSCHICFEVWAYILFFSNASMCKQF